MIRFRKTALLTSITLLVAASGLAACQGDDGGGDGDGDTGDGDGDVGDGDGDMGGGGNATGGNGSGGGGPGTGGNGTGGDLQGNPIAGTSSYDCSPASGEAGGFQIEEVAGDLTRPVLVSHAPDDDRLFIVEQAGIIRLLDGDTNPVVLDIANKVLDPSDGLMGYQEERGLLGLAFHPDFETNGLFYVHYNARQGQTDFSDGETIIAEYSMAGDTADAGSERVLLNLARPGSNHNGGTIAFGSDGMLYFALGDGGANAGNGQDETTLLGSILRINPEESGDNKYTIPPGNLSTVLPTAAPELWDYGLRNPYRMNFDACTGDLYIGDVGQDTKEEVNIELVGEGHHNYGWNIVEGTVCGPGANGGCENPDFTAPALDYDTNGSGAVVGGAVYRGSAMPWLRGTYFFTDQQQNQVWTTTFNRESGTVTTPVNVTDSFSTVGFAAIQNGNDGELYFAHLFGGSIYKLVPAE